MATFALMHGGFHTSKCWEVFAEELERRGHCAGFREMSQA